MAEEINPKDPARAAEAALSRREAMLQILRLGAVATTASGIGLWLHSRSARPEPRAAEAARKDHRITPGVEWPSMAVAQYPAETRAAEAGEPRALVQAALQDLGGMSRFVKPHTNRFSARIVGLTFHRFPANRLDQFLKLVVRVRMIHRTGRRSQAIQPYFADRGPRHVAVQFESP